MDPKTTALLIIDMQNDVMKKLVKNGPQVVPVIKKTVEACRSQGMPIFYVLRVHRADGSDVEIFRKDIFEKAPFLVEGSQGAAVINELKPQPTDYLISKQRFSGFFQTDLLLILMRLGIKTVALCGVQTPNCVRSTAVDAIAYDFNVTILEDATAAQTTEIHQANLFDMGNMGVDIRSADSFLEQLGATSPAL